MTPKDSKCPHDGYSDVYWCGDRVYKLKSEFPECPWCNPAPLDGVKRYDSIHDERCHIPLDDGDWVKWADHEASLKIEKEVHRLVEHKSSQIIKELQSALKAKEDELAQIRESLNVIVCAWCGHKGKKGAQELLDHVKECSRHPMKKAMDKLDELPKIAKLVEALHEIQEMFDGEADVDNNGHSNRAMKIDLIIDEATKGFSR